jgi:hypothetical protein
MSQRNSIPVGKIVQGAQPNVQAPVIRRVHGQDKDAAPTVLELVARSAEWRVPGNTLKSADVGELGYLPLRVPVVLGNEAIWSV